MLDLRAADVAAACLMAALNAYALLAGADFGGGVWDLLASGPRKRKQRALIADAIAPIWEANHVWLILAVVLLFTCFPGAFAQLAIALHIPISLMLIGIVLRGSAFTFRSYDPGYGDLQRRWGRVFASASVVTPLLLGVVVGAVASGGAGVVPDPRAGFAAVYLRPWITPFTISVGLFALLLFAFLAAVYLTVESREPAIQEDFRRRALASGIGVFFAAVLVLAASDSGAPLMTKGLLSAPWAVPLHLLTGGAAVTALGALWGKRYGVARVAAAAQVSLILWGWALAQYPYLLPPALTIRDAAAPEVTLKLVLGALVAGALVLFPSLYYLFRVFKARPAP